MSKDNGGAAFPTIARTVQVPLTAGTSSPKVEQAIPAQDGMTLRDYFAAQALGGILAAATQGGLPDHLTLSNAAGLAYSAADKMLFERNKPA